MERALDFDRTNVHLRYGASRKLSSDVLDLWLARIAKHVPSRLVSIIDLGCGTGRFTQRVPGALADRFSATVYSVDPSQRMLGVARENVARPDVITLEGAAEHVPLDDAAADLIFLSMVYHHIHDRRRAYKEFLRVLKPGGYLCIHTPTRELLNTYLWVPFFPGAREVEERRMPSSREVRESLEEHGFRLAAHEVVSQVFARDLQEYCGKISLRGLSTLQSIPGASFEAGLSRLRRYCETHKSDEAVCEQVELFIAVSPSP